MLENMCESAGNKNELNTGTEQATESADDPYAYLQRGEFSSESFKIEVKQLPKIYGINEFRKLLNKKLKLNSNKIKSPRRNSRYLFVCFRSEEEREKAIKVLSEFVWKGSQLLAIKAKPSADPLVTKRKQDSEDSENSKKIKTEDVSQEERLKISTIPLWNVDYKEQLEMKQDHIKDILKDLGNELSRQNPELREWLEKQKQKYDGLPCELLNIRHAEQIDGYRNKCEFSVGINEETGLRTVGFRVGAYVNGITSVGPVDCLRHISDSMKTAVKVFQEFVRKSDLEVFSPEFQTGHFRQLCVRSAAPDQLMLVVGICPQDLSEDKKTDFKNSLVEFFKEGDGKVANVTSLYYQEIIKKFKKSTGENLSPPVHLWGNPHIYDTILGLKFRISPEAFFQINSSGAEILYKSAIELGEPTDKSTVLDVCCGTGTIGLCFAKECNQVLGLEVVPQAIVDAKENAVANEIENSEFFAGRAEDILGNVCHKSTNDDMIAVVDPPRAGLHQKAVLRLRQITKINRIVYVSCAPKLALKNFIDLGRPESKTLHGEPFVPVKAVPVDMFPHTKHCELVISFKRWDQIQKEMEPKVTTSEDQHEMESKEVTSEEKQVTGDVQIKEEITVEESTMEESTMEERTMEVSTVRSSSE